MSSIEMNRPHSVCQVPTEDSAQAAENAPATTAHQADSQDTSQNDPDVALFNIAKSVYDDTRVYHGTVEESKTSIREHGFQKNRKADGLTAPIVKTDGQNPARKPMVSKLADDSRKAHFFITDKRLHKLLRRE